LITNLAPQKPSNAGAFLSYTFGAKAGRRIVKEVFRGGVISQRDGPGSIATISAPIPKLVPRIDYERIFVLDQDGSLLSEYALRDDSPFEYEDLRHAIPVNGMRHLVSFYQGEYAFTPFRVEDLWFVILSHGVPRIEERGSIGTLLAAMRIHLPPTLSPAVAAREDALREREREAEARAAILTRREQRVSHIESELNLAARKLWDLEKEVRAREDRMNALRDYALQMQRAFREAAANAALQRQAEEKPGTSRTSVPPPP